MDQKLLAELKAKLQEEKMRLERELSSFAKKDPAVKGDWDTRFPRAPLETNLEAEADEVEEYANKLGVEHALELHLQKVDRALEAINKGTYGDCQECGGPVPKERLLAYPEAGLCEACAPKSGFDT